MDRVFETFLKSFDDQLSIDKTGELSRETVGFRPFASARIVDSLGLHFPGTGEATSAQLSKWVLHATPEEKTAADLAIPIPLGGVHFVPGQFRIFYDFKNSDIVLDELAIAGVPLKGRLLDFGCSSGRNLAVLKRAFGEELDLYGADPAQSSIDWLNANVPGVHAAVNRQLPPLPYDDGMFDIIIAKSIWTHFSTSAAKAWFAEMARVLKPGGHFLFSTHGPHDIASRILYDNPLPNYEHFAGHEHWTRDAFLLDLVAGITTEGVYFQPYKKVGNQPDLTQVENADTSDWGLMFMTPDYLEKELMPADLKVVRRAVGRTGNRHDVYVVRRD